MITAIIQLVVIVLRYWANPDRMKRELEKATKAAYHNATAAFARKVKDHDETGVNSDIDNVLDRADRMHDDAE